MALLSMFSSPPPGPMEDLDLSSDDEYDGDDLYDIFSPQEIEASQLVPTGPTINIDDDLSEFVFATQASLEEELEQASSPIREQPRVSSRSKTSGSGGTRRDPPLFSSPLKANPSSSSASRRADQSQSNGLGAPYGDLPETSRSSSNSVPRRITPPSPSRHPYKQAEPHSNSSSRIKPSAHPVSPRRTFSAFKAARDVSDGRGIEWMSPPLKPTIPDSNLGRYPDSAVGPSRTPAQPNSDLAPNGGEKLSSTSSEITLSPEQTRVMEIVLAGESLFFTGSAGTGKSVLLREIIKQLSAIEVEDENGKKRKRKVAVTASTGIAGVNIGGQTLHAWAGLGLATEEVPTLANRIIRKHEDKKIGRIDPSVETALERWVQTEVLIVDEMSMVDGRFWDKLEAVAKLVRKDPRPFGDIQLVLCGDFFQLPPVPDRHNKKSFFAFEAKSWPFCVTRIIKLKQVFRQSNQTFVDMLTEARIGNLSERTIHQFRCLQRPVVYNDGIEATELFPMKNQADAANQSKLRKLGGDTRMFISIDKEGIKPNGDSYSHAEAVNLLDQHSRAPARLDLKIGAQVMLLVNKPAIGLCNGSVGKIVGFRSTIEEHQRIQEEAIERKLGQEVIDTESIKTMVSFLPTRILGEGLRKLLAQVIPEALPLPPAVALPLQPTNHAKTESDSAVPMMTPLPTTYRHDADLAKNKWPVVEFSDSQRMQQIMIVPHEFDVNNQKGQLEAKRIQVPLMLAWALSIHKAQGITIPRLKVDLGKTFEKGQAYVALSRATSMETLEISNFRPEGVKAHPLVITWSANLEEV